MQQLLIRLDDITPDMDWEKFERLAALLEQYQIHPIIGVVPDNHDAALRFQDPKVDFWEHIQALEKRGWVIAQHGFQHVYVNRSKGLLGINPFSEFAGLSYQKQYDKLAAGQKVLEQNGIAAGLFMAPGHTFDRKTLKALRKLGFTSVTDGYCSRPYRRAGLLFLPCTLSEPRVPKCFDTLCLHTNSMEAAQFDALAEFIGRHRGIIGNADEFVPGCRDGQPERSAGGKRGMGGRMQGCVHKTRTYVPFGWMEERKNLMLRRVRRFAAENEIMQAYFQRTDSEDAVQKKKKRLRGLPGLLIRLVIHRKYR